MRKAIFIVPYFGKLNNYFQIFLNSCKCNTEYNWLIITDDHTVYEFPDNVEVCYMTFYELQTTISQRFKDDKLIPNSPYKLCDFKPVYGYIFEKLIKSYKFWGYCDIDMIFGKIENFISDSDLEHYDKIGVLGHFTLIRNTKECNEIFMKEPNYKKILSSKESYKFDEEFGESYGFSINNIFKNNGLKIKPLNCMADIYVKSSNFRITNYNVQKCNYTTESKQKSLFTWKQGVLSRFYERNGKIEIKEYLYIHLQKRPMTVANKNLDFYKIIPNSFEDIEKDFSGKSLKNIKTKNINLHYFKIRIKNLKAKIKRKKEGLPWNGKRL